MEPATGNSTGPKVKIGFAIAYFVAGTLMVAIAWLTGRPQGDTLLTSLFDTTGLWILALGYCAPAAFLLFSSATFGFFLWRGRWVLYWITMLYLFGFPLYVLAGLTMYGDSQP